MHYDPHLQIGNIMIKLFAPKIQHLASKYLFSKIPSRSAISRWPFLDERARMFGILILRPATVVLRPLASCWPLHCTKMINSCFCKFDISTIFFSCKMTISFSDAWGGGTFADKSCGLQMDENSSHKQPWLKRRCIFGW